MENINIPILASAFVGTASFAIGTQSLLAPFKITLLFGVPSAPQSLTDPESSKTSQTPLYTTDHDAQNCISAFVRAKGVRDISFGLAYWAMAYTGDKRSIGIVMLSHAVTGFLDGVIVWQQGIRKEVVGHWGGTVVVTVFGAWSLYEGTAQEKLL